MKQGLELIEIAPGIDLKRDVLDMMEFEPAISPDLKIMPQEVFQKGLLGLAEKFDKYVMQF